MTALCTLAANLGTVESREDLMLLGTGSFFRGVKRPRREADHPPPSSAEIKNAWTCTSTPHTIVTFRQFVNIFYHENVIIICPISMFTAVLEYFTGNVILEDISHISEKHIFCCGVMMKTLLNVLWHYDAEIKKSLLVLCWGYYLISSGIMMETLLKLFGYYDGDIAKSSGIMLGILLNLFGYYDGEIT